MVVYKMGNLGHKWTLLMSPNEWLGYFVSPYVCAVCVFFSSSNQNLTADCAIYYMYLLSRIVSSLWANEYHVTANVKESGECLYEYDCSGFWTFREWLVHIARRNKMCIVNQFLSLH